MVEIETGLLRRQRAFRPRLRHQLHRPSVALPALVEGVHPDTLDAAGVGDGDRHSSRLPDVREQQVRRQRPAFVVVQKRRRRILPAALSRPPSCIRRVAAAATHPRVVLRVRPHNTSLGGTITVHLWFRAPKVQSPQ
eukprot:611600-Pleurochrysis_carterae.AAC.1